MGVGKKKPKERPVPFVTREEWGAIETNLKTRLKLPVKTVRYGYTGTETCRKRELCIDLIQVYQEELIDDYELDDLPYNFLVGGDGAIYEGRGWEFEAERPNRLKKLKGKCIDIAYIGSFESSLPTPIMSEAAQKFMEEAIESKKVEDLPHVMNLFDFFPEDNDFEEKNRRN